MNTSASEFTVYYYMQQVYIHIFMSFFVPRNDKPYCETCFHELFGVVCIACKQFIMGTVLEVSSCVT